MDELWNSTIQKTRSELNHFSHDHVILDFPISIVFITYSGLCHTYNKLDLYDLNYAYTNLSGKVIFGLESVPHNFHGFNDIDHFSFLSLRVCIEMFILPRIKTSCVSTLNIILPYISSWNKEIDGVFEQARATCDLSIVIYVI